MMVGVKIACVFQSTSSARRTTFPVNYATPHRFDFNPRPPRGGRLGCTTQRAIDSVFQSTSSARRTTVTRFGDNWEALNFNPRPPRGGRLQAAQSRHRPQYFNPRPPRGGRLLSKFVLVVLRRISIHVLREEDD